MAIGPRPLPGRPPGAARGRGFQCLKLLIAREIIQGTLSRANKFEPASRCGMVEHFEEAVGEFAVSRPDGTIHLRHLKPFKCDIVLL
jgi:hypothetical protein